MSPSWSNQEKETFEQMICWNQIIDDFYFGVFSETEIARENPSVSVSLSLCLFLSLCLSLSLSFPIGMALYLCSDFNFFFPPLFALIVDNGVAFSLRSCVILGDWPLGLSFPHP